MTEQVEVQIEHLAVEIGNLVIGHALAKHIAGRSVALPDGVVPMLDAALAAKDGIEKPGHVTGSEDTGLTRLQEAIDDDAIVHLDAAALQETGFRNHAHTDHYHVAGEGPAALRLHRLDRRPAPDGRRTVADDDLYTMLFEAAPDKGRHARHVEFSEQFVAFEHGDFDTDLPQRSGDLQTDEAAADHHGPPRISRTRADRFAHVLRVLNHLGPRISRTRADRFVAAPQ